MFFKSKNQNNSLVKDKLLATNHIDPAINAIDVKTRLIDLKKIINDKDLLNFIWNDKETLSINGLTISQDLLNDIELCKDTDAIINLCNDYNIDITQTIVNQLNKEFKTGKEKLINNLKKDSLKLSSIFLNFSSHAKKILNDENIYTLYVGAYFVNGIDANDNEVNAPLLLWPIEITEKNGTIFFTKQSDVPVLNDKFNFYFSNLNKMQINFDDQNTWKAFKEYPKILSKLLQESDFNKKELVAFQTNYKKDFKLINSCVLMLVEPTGGCIKRDIEYIEKQRSQPFAINTKIVDNEKFEQKVINEDYGIIEINQKLNIYQKYAVKSALMQNTLIYGPPGTGKSETIASIIANIIYEGKNVLISSEKKAALDVLDERLGNLKYLAIFAYKCNEKEIFYERLSNFGKLIHKKLDKLEIDFPKKEFIEITNLNNDINIFLNNKKSPINVNDFLNVASTIDINSYIVAKENGTIDAINEILDNQKISIKELLSFINNFNRNIQPYQEELNFFLSHATFNMYDSKSLSKFIEKYEESSKEEFIFSDLIMKNKINTKRSIFGTKSLVVGLDQPRYVEFIKVLISLNLNSLSRNDILFIKNMNLSNNEIEDFYQYDLFMNQIKNNKYLGKDTIYSSFKKYIAKREINTKTNSDVIFNDYLNHIVNKIKKLSNDEKEKVFEVFSKAELSKKPSMNLLIKTYYKQLRLLFPIWILSPEQTSILCPIKQGIFDYGIFDEASQMFLEKSYPLVYRCKTSIIAGDDKQLQPTSFFMKKSEYDETDISNTKTDSLFEMASVCLWTKFHLRNHYRSKSADLIAFSNKNFYDDNLEFSTHNGANYKPIEVIEVDGIWKNNYNIKEIDAVLDILRNPDLINKKILIITLNSIQYKFLLSKFCDQFANTKMYQKFENGSLDIKTIENVQGNEADIVILSTSFAKNENGTFRQFFGPISQTGGTNRLNVAITRAKEKMYIVKSIKSSDIKISENINNNTFKEFIQYVEMCHKKPQLEINNKIAPQEKICDPYQRDLLKYIQSIVSDKQVVLCNYSIGKNKFDIAVLNKNTNCVDFGLVINNNNDGLDLKSTLTNLDKTQFLCDIGYNVYYLNILDWYIKTSKIKNEISQQLLYSK